MKIGFSFGRCVRDIVNGDVKLEDVMVIVARTLMRTEDDVLFVVKEYHAYGHLYGLDLEKCNEVGLELFRRGKLHQPRVHGSYRYSVNENFVWMDLFPTDIQETNEGVQSAWENYRVMLQLAGEQLPSQEDAPTD